MPLYEFECRGCGHRFEHLARGSDTPACPSCQSHDLARLFSAFAVRVAAPAGPPAPAPESCGRCGDPRGPGACSMN